MGKWKQSDSHRPQSTDTEVSLCSKKERCFFPPHVTFFVFLYFFVFLFLCFVVFLFLYFFVFFVFFVFVFFFSNLGYLHIIFLWYMKFK